MKHALKLFTLLSLSSILFIPSPVSAVNSGDNAASSALSATPPPAVEEFNYPGADQIFAERGIRLLKGDGKIALADCATEGPVIRVKSVTLRDSCFRVVGASGWLTMEIPRVFAIQGGSHNVTARITTDGKTEAVDISPGEYTPVGEGESKDPATLVELHAS
ncbi:hypothetical protein SAMN02982929_00764 [Saccharopolyspora kobensis]|uniref:Secreted protein n=1 Tax=Saccharopolyspora kobensis TaxID=146035 RepID=A0A1H5V491_9PSEU|nr:hypothetical protein [Saccharopolyspora kobensis]SEF82242.1 hypothetical protein SAMN02982929_00764 [Saccharopolyspora kobensis]SFC65315.1 hypothetical protein SAMN05216506_1011307 [Saccharopolyspora kobensis]